MQRMAPRTSIRSSRTRSFLAPDRPNTDDRMVLVRPARYLPVWHSNDRNVCVRPPFCISHLRAASLFCVLGQTEHRLVVACVASAWSDFGSRYWLSRIFQWWLPQYSGTLAELGLRDSYVDWLLGRIPKKRTPKIASEWSVSGTSVL